MAGTLVFQRKIKLCLQPLPFRLETLPNLIQILCIKPLLWLGACKLPLREGQTLAMELLMQRALEAGLETAVLDSPAYQRYAEARRVSGLNG